MFPRFLPLFVLVATLPVGLAVGDISVNFTGTGGRDVTGPTGAVVVRGNYTNLGGTNGSASNLVDDAGVPTTADITWAADASWMSGTPGASQDAALMDGYLAIGQDEYGIDITVSDIPYAAYDVYVYFGNNIMGATGKVRVNGGGTQFFYSTAGLLPTFSGFDPCTGRTSSAPEPGNYAVFENVQGPTLVIQQANSGGGNDSGVMGFQIVERAAGPRITLDDSLYDSDETITVSFAAGPGDAENNVVLVPRGGDPATDVLARLYVGGTGGPTSAPVSGSVAFASGGGLGFGWYDAYFLGDGSGAAVLWGPETFEIALPDVMVVPVGAGSYASSPPPHEGPGALFEAFQRRFYVVDEANARPIPTNDWWTDLIINPYAGLMWAYPLVVSAGEQGANVFLPIEFNGGGTEMIANFPVRLGGEAVPVPDPTYRLIEDFEAGTYGAGWTVTGTAFGPGPAAGTLPAQGAVTGYLGTYLVNSFNGGDASTGLLASPGFTVDRDWMHFLVGGGNHPWSPGAPEVAAVNLVVGGNVVATATGAESEELQWVAWDVSAYQGQVASIEIVDTVTGGWGHILADNFFLSDDGSAPSSLLGTEFLAADARALSWSDWALTMRLGHSVTQYMDVTFGRGMPTVWVELSNIDPVIQLDAPPSFFDDAGSPVTLPATTERLGFEYGGRRFGLYLPDGTGVDVSGTTLLLDLPTGGDYYVLVALDSVGNLASLAPYAYAVPRDTRYDWVYDPAGGTVTTQWSVTADALKGTNTEIIQGWIPHHYRSTTNNLALNGMEFLTPKGTLKVATGSSFELVYDFPGMAPHVPAPVAAGLANDYIPSRMGIELNKYAGVTNYGADSYFGGKDLLRFARYLEMAKEIGHPSAAALETNLRTALVDWLTYTPGETEHYFAWMPVSGGLVGFNESFFTTQYTDHHFHYGYNVISSAILGRYDPDFLANYGEMVRLVAKDYANWERSDDRFPYLRTFDIWAGHSLAAGFSSPGGNNQESSSEAINSWAGLFFLGAELGDPGMMAAGAMGYTVETEATLEYWYNFYGDTWSPNYTDNIVGILFDRGPIFATYFSADPAWVYAIQWIPSSPTIQGFLVRDPAFSAQVWQNLLDDRTAAMGNADIAGMGASLGNLLLGYVMMFDPDFAAAELDRLWSINSPVVTDVFTGGISYYFTHTMRTLGLIQFDYHFSNGLGSVFHNAGTGVTTYVVYNPEATPRTVEVFQGGVSIGCIDVAPRTLESTTSLVSCNASGLADWGVLGR